MGVSRWRFRISGGVSDESASGEPRARGAPRGGRGALGDVPPAGPWWSGRERPPRRRPCSSAPAARRPPPPARRPPARGGDMTGTFTFSVQNFQPTINIIERAIPAFQQQHPGVTIKYTPVAFSDHGRQGGPGDRRRIGHDGFHTYTGFWRGTDAANVMLPLTPVLFKKAELEQMFFPNVPGRRLVEARRRRTSCPSPSASTARCSSGTTSWPSGTGSIPRASPPSTRSPRGRSS